MDEEKIKKARELWEEALTLTTFTGKSKNIRKALALLSEAEEEDKPEQDKFYVPKDIKHIVKNVCPVCGGQLIGKPGRCPKHGIVEPEQRLESEEESIVIMHCQGSDYVDLIEYEKLKNRLEASEQAVEYYKKCIDRNAEAIQQQAEQIERLEDTLDKIKNWCKAYPVKVSPEPTDDEWKQADKALKEVGLSLSIISVSNIRHVVNGIKEIIEQALGNES